MSEVAPQVLTTQQAFHALENKQEIPRFPSRVVKVGDRSLTVKIAPQTIHPGDETGEGREKRHAFAIYLQEGQTDPVRYRTVEGPMEHSHSTGEEQHNNATNELEIIEKITTSERPIEAIAGLVTKPVGAKAGEREGETFRHVEAGVAGYTLWDTLTTLEGYQGGLLTTDERDLLELRLVDESLVALERFSEMGYRQRHPHMRNFQVGEDGRVTLIDYSRSHKFSEQPPVDNDFGRVAPDSFIFVAYLERYFPQVLQRAGFDPGLIEMGHVNDQDFNNANLQALRQRLFERMQQSSVYNDTQLQARVGSVMLDHTLQEMGFSGVTDGDRAAIFDAIDDGNC